MDSGILDVLGRLHERKVLVVGDVMLDRYIHGSVTRISPEAPVPIVLVEQESTYPGGAAHLANSIAGLGACVTIVGVRGDDMAGSQLVRKLQQRSILTDHILVDASRPTIQKVKVVSQGQQMIRVDYEKYHAFDGAISEGIKRMIDESMQGVDLVIVSDYAKGIVSKEIMECVLQNAFRRNTTVAIDPKPQHKEMYRNATLVLPNATEAREMAGIGDSSDKGIEQAAAALARAFNSHIVITRGQSGMSVFDKNLELARHVPTKAQQVFDITGAGDTSTAAFALAFASGASLEDAAEIANHAAGVAVTKVGISTVTIGEIRASMLAER